MKRTAALAVGLLALSTVASFAGDDASFDQVARGSYLAKLGDCASCHTAPGGKPFAGGVVVATPFGNLVGANITPDRATGIGTWTEADFERAMSEGIAKGGHRLYAAMPFTAYTKVAKSDDAALWAYLQTIQPVKHPVVTNRLPFPFDLRANLYGWNLLNFTPGIYAPDPAKSETWNRGAYIVQGLGHCSACHTPKNITGGDESDRFLQGAVVQGWLAPNIAADPHRGIGSWSIADITDYLKTGANRFDIASGPMADVVAHSSQYWVDSDRAAVAVYLKELGNAQAAARQPIAAGDPAMVAGKAIYADRCSSCHTGTGEGVPYLFPRLAKAPLVNNDDATSLIHVVLAGSRAGGTDARPTMPAMPSFAWELDDAEIADVLTYVRNEWGNAAPAVSPSKIANLRARLRQ
jgi:mono/diheme cytochrome c family protein